MKREQYIKMCKWHIQDPQDTLKRPKLEIMGINEEVQAKWLQIYFIK